MRTVRVRIVGDVQNVGFRSWTKHRADHMGVRGWVRNNADGTVEAVFEADDGKITEMLEECRRGPPGSYVEDISVRDEKFSSGFDGFEIIV